VPLPGIRTNVEWVLPEKPKDIPVGTRIAFTIRPHETLACRLITQLSAFSPRHYLNDRALSKVTAEANPQSVDFRYQINDRGTDFSMAYRGNFENAPSAVGFDAGNESNLNGVSVTFVIQNYPRQGIAFFTQVAPSEKSEEISSVIA